MYPRLKVTLLFVLLFTSVVGQRFTQVPLKSRTITLNGRPGLIKAENDEDVFVAVILELRRELIARRIDSLERKGIWIDEMIVPGVYFARMNLRNNLGESRNVIGNLEILDAVDKVNPNLWSRNFDKFTYLDRGDVRRNYVVNEDSTLNIIVSFFKSLRSSEIAKLVRKIDSEFITLKDFRYQMKATFSELKQLANSDWVKWVDPANPPPLPDNDRTRSNLEVDNLQNFNQTTGKPDKLGGNKITIGIFDKGIDENHIDFKERVVSNDNRVDDHATHVAGIAAGSGYASDKRDSEGNSNNGSPYQWRGMAPLATILDINSDFGTNETKYSHYIINESMDLSNHSYGISYDGEYNQSNAVRDKLIRGSLSGNKITPGRIQIFSAGNAGLDATRPGQQTGYFSLSKQLKNGLVIGNYDVSNKTISATSSLGPAYDGRVKPDLVAPGKEVVSTYSQGSKKNAYALKSGTSMAAPVVTGIIALIMELYEKTFELDLDKKPMLPSTIRALVINSATDLVSNGPYFNNQEHNDVTAFKGPDFATGYGLINAMGAAEEVQKKRVVEDKVNRTCEKKIYEFRVSRSESPIVKVTLAWDDLPSSTALSDTVPKLINDLDLELIDPNGKVYYPWILNQRIYSAKGKLLPNEDQHCGDEIIVLRTFMPSTRPYLRQESIVPVAATTGKDHLNNIEKVEAEAVDGVWKASVTAFGIVGGLQYFSVVGVKTEGTQPRQQRFRRFNLKFFK